MAIGDLISRPGQFEVDESLLIGAGTNYPVRTVDGLGTPVVRENDRERTAEHGTIAGPDYLDARQIVLAMGVRAPDRQALQPRVDALARALTPRTGDPVPFAVRETFETRVVWMRPRRLDLPFDEIAPWGILQAVTCGLVCPDPFAYSVATDSAQAEIAASGTSASVTVRNDGSGRTRPTLTIGGPATNPRVGNAGREIRLEGVFTSTDEIVVDVAKRLVTVNGVDDYTVVAADNEWWDLAPGDNALTFARDDAPTTAATLDVVWRDGYLTAI